jgi:excisionase family DNA binding protein
MNDTVLQLYGAYLQETGDKTAAASLTLADALLQSDRPMPTPVAETPAPRGLTVRFAAQRLGTGIHTIYNLCRSGELPCYKIGKAIRILPEALEAYERKQGADLPRPPTLDRHRR